MDELTFLDVISGRRRGPGAALLRGLLNVATPVYRAALVARNGLFDAGLRKIYRVGVPVVSIGNITTGGTGKTPLVAWLANWCRNAGFQPVLISRGYRSLDEAGNDERRVLDRLCPGVPHLQGRDRVAVARRAMAEQSPDVLILDDAFQHRRLGRDLDMALIDSLNPWGYRHLLPRGLLREPPSGLRRADLIVLTRIDQISKAQASRLRSEVRSHSSAPLIEAGFRPHALLSADGQLASLSHLAGQHVVALCGIGNPAGFLGTLRRAGFDLDEQWFRAYPDHHHYTQVDVEDIIAWADSCSATAVLTTQKDLVKLDHWPAGAVPLWGLAIEIDFFHGREILEASLRNLLPETRAPLVE